MAWEARRKANASYSKTVRRSRCKPGLAWEGPVNPISVAERSS
jgi:hypothetical protein